MGLYGIIWDHIGSFGIIKDPIGLYGIIWDQIGLYGIIWHHIGSYGIKLKTFHLGHCDQRFLNRQTRLESTARF